MEGMGEEMAGLSVPSFSSHIQLLYVTSIECWSLRVCL